MKLIKNIYLTNSCLYYKVCIEKVKVLTKKEFIMKEKNMKFGSRWGFILSAVGSAVGMANVWGFPAKMGANGGGGGSALGDIAGLGVTLGAMSGVIGMTKDAMAPMMQTGAAAPAATGWTCGCGTQNIQTNFCPNCGGKKPEPQVGWNCTACGHTGITTNFCPNCGAKKPDPNAGWICPDCGQRDIKTNFCPNCGHKKD